MTTDDPIRFRTFADDDDPAWATRARTAGEPPAIAAPPRRKSPILAWGAGLALLAGAAIAVVLLPGPTALHRDGSLSTAALQVHRFVAPETRLSAGAVLPCYVAGAPVGSRSLADCAQSNGVASGRLDVGSRPGALVFAVPPPVGRPAPRDGLSDGGYDGPPAERLQARPLPPFAFAGPPPRQTFPQTEPSSVERPIDRGPPQPVERYDGAADQPRLDPEDSIRAAQTFYESLARADGARAASVVVPEKRASGPLSAGAITRFYSSLRAPLRLTRLYPLDDHTVMARYAFVDPNGAVCQGSARVTTTERDGGVYVKSVRALDGC